MEKSKKIPGFSAYSVNANGDVFSENYNRKGFKLKIAQYRPKDGYPSVTIKSDKGKFYTKRVHVLVCLVFLGDRKKEMEINHKNGIKSDNRLSNLEYCSHRENIKHAIRNKLMMPPPIHRGEKQHLAKLTESDVVEIRRIAYGKKQYGRKGLAIRFNVSESLIKQVVNRIIWTHV